LITNDQALTYTLLLLLGLLIGYFISSRIASLRLRNLDALWRIRIDDAVSRRVLEREGELRREAAQRSGRVLSGRVLERFAPILGSFPFDPHDAIWIGSPVDFIVFDGLSEDREGSGSLRRIVFVEVKSGSGKLSKRQRRIKEIIEGKMVSWEEFRVPKH